MEEWRDVPGYEGKYQISIETKEGKCRSLDYNHTGKVGELKNTRDKRDGRIYWKLSRTNQQAARWIAITYPKLVGGEWFPGAEIDHIDTDPGNNCPSNLRWVSSSGNKNNPLTKIHMSECQKGKHLSEETKKKIGASQIGRHHTDESRVKISQGLTNHPSTSKKVEQFSKAGEYIATYPSTMEASRQTSVHCGNIGECCLGRRKTAGGYKWKYAS